MKFPFTKKQIRDILNDDKYIETDYLWEKKKNKIIPVYIGLATESKDIGLVFAIRGGRSMGVALILEKQRIRGINRRGRHQGRNGTIVRGWHQHIEEEGMVEPINKDFSDLDEIIEYALNKWKIRRHGPMAPSLWNYKRRSKQ